MRVHSKVLTLLLLTAGYASATALCTSFNGDTLAQLQTAGSCSIGDVIFSDFTYTYTGYYSSGPYQAPPSAGDYVPATAVFVNVDALDSELKFQADWSSLAPDSVTLTVGLQAVDNVGAIQTVDSEIQASLVPPGANTALDNITKTGTCVSGCPLSNEDILTAPLENANIAPGTTLNLLVQVVANMDASASCGGSNTYANGGCDPNDYNGADSTGAHISQVGIQVDGNVPEPASFLFVGTALGLAALLKKRFA